MSSNDNDKDINDNVEVEIKQGNMTNDNDLSV
jgi:hypothetical protein